MNRGFKNPTWKEFKTASEELSQTRLSTRIQHISYWAKSWLIKDSSNRRQAVAALRKESGFPGAMADQILSLFLEG